MVKNSKKRSSIILDKSIREEIKRVAQSNGRTMIGQLRYWVNNEKSNGKK